VQRLRQQQLDLDHPHRPAVLLLLRRLLIPSSLPAPPHRGELFLQRSDAFFHFVSEKMRKTVAFFGKMWYNKYDFRKITAFPT
jgi:hypothetical protein